MWGYFVRRLLIVLPTIIIAVSIVYLMLRFTPGGPFDSERRVSQRVMENILAKYDLDKPPLEQYFNYMKNFLSGDFGASFRYADWSVNELIRAALPVTLTIGGIAVILAFSIGVLLGVLAAIYQNTKFDFFLSFFYNIGSVVPAFVLGPFLLLLFAIWLPIFPAGGWNDFAPKYMVLPILLLVIINISSISRVMRASTLEVLSSNYVRTAFAKGLPLSIVLFRHVLKPAILPAVSLLGPIAISSITSTIITEYVFSLPGIGKLLVNAASNRDYTLVTGLVALITVIAVTFNFLVDLLYSLLDPKIAY